ncbi:MAG: AsmA family protein [Bdellovibrionales bacterium]
MSKAGKFFSVLLVIVLLIAGAVAIFVATFDINQYRDQIAEALSKQTGRTVRFGGPIKLAISTHGIGVAAENASIGNPPWASREEMANIGKLQLGVGLISLLDKKFVITDLIVKNADIQLETNARDEHNWDMKPVAGPGAPPASGPRGGEKTAGGTTSAAPIGVLIEDVLITDSKLSMRDKDGNISALAVEKLTLGQEDRGIAVSLTGEYNGQPIRLAVRTGAKDIMADSKWPYDADITYGPYHLTSQGNVDTREKTADMNPYELTAGNSPLHGQIMANFGGEKPQIRATVMGDKLNPADFKPPAASGGNKPAASQEAAPAASGQGGPLFSTAPLNLEALKSANATIDLAFAEVTLGKAVLKQVSGKVALNDGNLSVVPVKATLGESPLTGDVKLQAGGTPQYSLNFKAPGVDIATLLQMMDMNGFLTGKGDADIALSGTGNSLHDMAASTQGRILVTAQGGKISSSLAGEIASGLTQVLAPGGDGNPVLNCLAARFDVTQGVAKDNGLLLDSDSSTVAGAGGFNLGAETIELKLMAKPKVVDTKGVTPAVLITGPLTAPKVGVDTAGVAQGVAGALLKDKTGGVGGALKGILGAGSAADGGVPVLAQAPQGQNACLYTLDHKAEAAAAAPASPPANSGIKGVAGEKAKDLGKQHKKGKLGQ